MHRQINDEARRIAANIAKLPGRSCCCDEKAPNMSDRG
jgi:hypothetical protein